MSEPRDILADRLNTQPAIFKGCSSSELGVMAGVSVGVWLPLGLLLAGLMGAVTMGFGIAGVGTVATVVALAGVFQRLRSCTRSTLDSSGLRSSPVAPSIEVAQPGTLSVPVLPGQQ